jgi:hypothetical protein
MSSNVRVGNHDRLLYSNRKQQMEPHQLNHERTMFKCIGYTGSPFNPRTCGQFTYTIW